MSPPVFDFDILPLFLGLVKFYSIVEQRIVYSSFFVDVSFCELC